MSLKIKRLMLVGYFLLAGVLLLSSPRGVDAAGELDTSFNSGSGANGAVATIAVQPDGKIMIGGGFTSFNGTSGQGVQRLNPDGTLDTSFHPETRPNSFVYAMALQADGRIVIGGYFIDQFHTFAYTARLNEDGSLDPWFSSGSGQSASYVQTIAAQADGKIIIVGYFDTYDGAPRHRIARLNADGSIDTTFDPGSDANGVTTAVQADGKILIGGDLGIKRLLSAPSEVSFSTSSYVVGEGEGNAKITLTRTGGSRAKTVAKVTLTDVTTNSNDYRFRPGSLDTSFHPDQINGNVVYTTALQPDGAVIIGGAFTGYNGAPRNGIARLNADGSLDTSFDPGAGVSGLNKLVRTIAVQPDHKIIIGGSFNSYNNTPCHSLVRLNPDGSLDPSFNTSFAALGGVVPVRKIVLQPDGRVIISGEFARSAGAFTDHIARLNADGSLDFSFNPPGPNGNVFTTALQADGRVIIGGDFTSYNGTPRSCIARLNRDGSLDTSFNPGIGANAIVRTTALQADGRVIIGGDFTSFDAQPRNGVARLNPDGSLDSLFNPSVGLVGAFTSAVQPDGKIILGGVARLNPDGSLDTSFRSGAAGRVYTSAVQPNGNIIIGGEFSGLIVRLTGDLFVTWEAGDLTDKTVLLPIIDDHITEADETSTLTLTPLTNATTGAYTSATLTIFDNESALTNLSAVSASGAYNGTAILTATLNASGSPLSGKTISFKLNNNSVGAAISDSNGVATLTGVSIAGISAGTYDGAVEASFAGELAYHSSSINGPLQVDKATAQIIWNNPADISYGTPLDNTELNAMANVPGAFIYAPATNTILSAGNGQSLHVEFAPADATNYNSASMDVTINVAKALLTIKADDQSRIYGDANPALAGTITGLLNGDAITATYSTNANAANAVGTFDIVPVAVDSSPATLRNYNVTLTTGTLTITKAPLTVAGADATREYGDANPSFSGNIVGLRNGDNITAIYASDARSASNVGSYTVIPSLNDPDRKLDNYSLTSTNGTLTVTKAVLTIKADSQTKIYGAANPTLTGIVTGIRNGDAISGAYNTSATGTSPIGSYQIVATPVDAAPARLGNYDVILINSTLTVTKAALIVTVGDTSKTYGDVNPEFTGTISGLRDGDAIGAIYASPATSTSPVGAYPIVATLQDASNKLANYQVTSTNGTLTVVKATLTITWNNPADIPEGTTLSSTQLNATASFQGASVAGIFTYTPPSGTVLNAGAQQDLWASFVPVDSANFNSPATAAVKINVLTIQQATTNLVTDLVSSGLVPEARANAVTNALVNAVVTINQSTPARRAQAADLLRGYIGVVGGQVTAGRLPAAQGQALIASLNNLLVLIKP